MGSLAVARGTFSCGMWDLGFPGAQTVKNLPAIQETWVQSLGQADPLEKGKATHSSILVWRIPWTEEPRGLKSTGLESRTWLRDRYIFTFLRPRAEAKVLTLHTG